MDHMDGHISPSPMRERPRHSSMLPETVTARPSNAGTPTASRRLKSPDPSAKTAVNVAIRVRPPLQPTDHGYALVPPRFRSSTCHVAADQTHLHVQSAQNRKTFAFDRIFDQHTQQEAIWHHLSDSVDSFLQGYNVSVLAYGQSGSGKSFTMGTGGRVNHQDSQGIIPRAATALFKMLSERPVAGTSSTKPEPQRYSTYGHASPTKPYPAARHWSLKASYVEIYNEQLRDLLLSDSIPANARPQVHIREDTKGHILLSGVTQRNVASPQDLLAALELGSSIRQTDNTVINAKSSRSHAIFTLNLVTKNTSVSTPSQEKRYSVPLPRMNNELPSSEIHSKLHFVDLAGSERLKHTGAQGERAKEGISINAGLASLGKVISQLSSRQNGGHVSYRDSRLTRLLQDSLGGNAITYMLACITPAEFHLSETLNTLHYAQRARAIQSKPEIQRLVTGEDHNVRIERLQAEIALLREQLSTGGDSRTIDDRDRSVRQAVELQEQLVDMQQIYKALNARHALLIEELGKAHQEPLPDTPMLNQGVGDNSVKRLQRSTSFAEAVENVVTEYEKTIANLEVALAATRSALSSKDKTLLDNDLKMTSMQSSIQQMQARLHILAEQDANNEAYLRHLESEAHGASTSEEKSSALVTALRSELSRSKEVHNGSEAYISTLEARLAEAEQDHAIMQRELDRLEKVVERQRSIGRLDGLLADLDSIRKADRPSTPMREPHAASPPMSPPSPVPAFHDDQVPFASISRCRSPVSPLEPSTVAKDMAGHHDVDMSSSDFMTEKLETLTQELFDLRGEYEATVLDHDDLQRKYKVALQALAEAQKVLSEDATEAAETLNPSLDPFLDVRGRGEQRSLQPISSRSRSVSPSSISHRQASTPSSPATSSKSEEHLHSDYGPPSEPVAKVVSSDKDRTHQKLVRAHQEALDQIETLKKELFHARVATVPSPTPRKSPLLRRKPSQDVPINLNYISADRSNRSFAMLRNISLDHFEHSPELRQTFDLQLDQIMSDMHDRTGKLQESQLELAGIRKDLENKTTMLAGLSRERSSLMASTQVDLTVVGKMRDQLEQNQQHFRLLQESSASTEASLQARIRLLEAQLANDFDNDNEALLDLPGSFVKEGSPDQGEHEQTRMAKCKCGPEKAHDISTQAESQENLTLVEASKSQLAAQSDSHSISIKSVDTASSSQDAVNGLRSRIAELEKALGVMSDKEQKSDRLLQELEDQLSSTYDQQQASAKQMSAVQNERQLQLEEATKAKEGLEKQIEEMQQRVVVLETQHHDSVRLSAVTLRRLDRDALGLEPLSPRSPGRRIGHSASTSSLNQQQRPSSPAGSGTMAPLSPPPAMPLPPLPSSPSTPAMVSPVMSNNGGFHGRGAGPSLASPHLDGGHVSDINSITAIEERERRIRTVEKHLYAEKQLTATLEEALVDVETAQMKTRSELEEWRKRCTSMEDELIGLRRERSNSRSSLQAVEEEREMRLKAERARAALEERMRELNVVTTKKKKKNALNCF